MKRIQQFKHKGLEPDHGKDEDLEDLFEENINKVDECSLGIDLELLWSTELGAGVYSTPLITDLDNDGTPEIIIHTLSRFVEVLEATNGEKSPGWPFIFSENLFHSSPILFDQSSSHSRLFISSTYDGQILFFDKNGRRKKDYYIQLPPLILHKHWYEKDINNETELGEITPSYFYRMVPISDDDTDDYLDLTLDSISNDSDEENDYEFDEDRSHEKNNDKNKDEKTQGQEQELYEKDDFEKPQYFDSPFEQPRQRQQERITEEAKEAMKILGHFGEYSDLEFQFSSKIENSFSKNREQYINDQMGKIKEELTQSYLFVDPHILSTPVITPSNELVLSVSYYFDTYKQNEPEYRDLELTNYVAGGIIVYDLNVKQIKWIRHLDLSTQESENQAFVYPSPTVVDLDGDGKLDIIIGTSLGNIYALDMDGDLKPGFPIEMGEIQAQIACVDLTGDGNLEIIATSVISNIRVFDNLGKELWSKEIIGFCSQTPTIGDVNGDGKLDIVITTESGYIYVFNRGGEILDGFPIRITNKITAPILIIKLLPQNFKHSHLVFVSWDGMLHILDPIKGCETKTDIGEMSYSMVLADDFVGNNKIQLLVTTMGGHCYAFDTNTPYNPLRSWSSQVQSINGFVQREASQGVIFLPNTRKENSISGRKFQVQFQIIDFQNQLEVDYEYNVKIFIDSVLVFQNVYKNTGTYSVILNTPKQIKSSLLRIEMFNKNLLKFEDSFLIHTHQDFFTKLRFSLFIPFFLMSIVIIFTREKKTPLPR
ncbi:protein defective in exine formation [Anaeramoeba flamelloides]|uniref:Protein defective in exine formation n=1 Tax=Anaeramoeba flamelloides TaxID=1746091 RepID=A0AAV7ZKR4_9EUKA|nr:protein defective in exine formation [Anaeramoeba flamelloides]